MKIKLLGAVLALGLATSSLATERTVMLKVAEMNCQLCAYLVNRELREIDGVITTKAAIDNGTVKVVAEDKVSNQQLLDAIAKLQYHAEVMQ